MSGMCLPLSWGVRCLLLASLSSSQTPRTSSASPSTLSCPRILRITTMLFAPFFPTRLSSIITLVSVSPSIASSAQILLTSIRLTFSSIRKARCQAGDHNILPYSPLSSLSPVLATVARILSFSSHLVPIARRNDFCLTIRCLF